MPARSRAGRRRRVLSEEQADNPGAAREAALRLLEAARRTRTQLARKLRERGFRPEVVRAVVARLAQVGLVNDFEYASAFLRERLQRRSASWRNLEQELRRRGIPGDVVAQARADVQAEAGAESGEVEAARRVLGQVARRYAGLDPRVRRQRLIALLARRGFDYAAIAEALGEEEPGSG